MNPISSLTKTRVLLSSTLVLSLAALISVAVKPRPVVPKAGAVVSSQGTAVKVEARSSHVAVHESGSELYAEYTVTLEGAVAPPDHVALALVLDRSGSMAGQKLFIAEGTPVSPRQIGRSARVGVDYAGAWAKAPLRFFDRRVVR